ncbi:extensin [Actinomycetota bacterium Odt1-20B]
MNRPQPLATSKAAATPKVIAAREAITLLTAMTRVLCAVGLLALIFTTVNVTRFATTHQVPLPIAILLDPMLAIALGGVLYVDARLASWGLHPPIWSTALRWCAGSVAALMNTWESLWPDDRIGWPHRADPAAVLLHLTPALLLIALTETIAAYRRTVTELLNQIDDPDPPDPTTSPAPLTPLTPLGDRSTDDHSKPGPAPTDPPHTPPQPGASTPLPASTTLSDPHTASNAAPSAAHTGRDTPPLPPQAPGRPPPAVDATDAALWARAIALNDHSLTTTGKPATIWRLRTDLHIGPRRARQIHDHLPTHRPDPPPHNPIV